MVRFQRQYAVVVQACGATPHDDVAVRQRYAPYRVGTTRAAEQEHRPVVQVFLERRRDPALFEEAHARERGGGHGHAEGRRFLFDIHG